MRIEVRQEPVTVLATYADVPIAFEVNEIFDVIEEGGSGRLTLCARPLPIPYIKDYDALAGAPAHWAQRFDLSTWGFLSAFSDGRCVGRAAVAGDTRTLGMNEGRRDVAVLWDIRVIPAMRHRGVGSALFDRAMTWTSGNGYRQLTIETQNINVAACRFYARRGCILAAAYHDAYPECPGEIKLLWLKDLAQPSEETGLNSSEA